MKLRRKILLIQIWLRISSNHISHMVIRKARHVIALVYHFRVHLFLDIGASLYECTNYFYHLIFLIKNQVFILFNILLILLYGSLIIILCILCLLLHVVIWLHQVIYLVVYLLQFHYQSFFYVAPVRNFVVFVLVLQIIFHSYLILVNLYIIFK